MKAMNIRGSCERLCNCASLVIMRSRSSGDKSRFVAVLFPVQLRYLMECFDDHLEPLRIRFL